MRTAAYGALTFFLMATTNAAPARADRVLVLGDSWGPPMALALDQIFVAEGHTNAGVVNGAVGGETAANLSTPTGLAGITTKLNANPTVDLIHLSIGGNDFLGNWNSTFTQEQEDALFNQMLTDTDTIVQHILSVRPDMKIFHSSYDYPRPLPLGTPLEVNSASENFFALEEPYAAGILPLTVHNFNGLMQLHFGYSPLGLPPFDPTLPRIDLPGPPEAFGDAIHLNAAGYLTLAQETYDVYYETRLAIAGDGSLDGTVGPEDYTLWANGFGIGDEFTAGDYNFDEMVGPSDYTLWANNFGMMTGGDTPQAVPEPASLILAGSGIVGLLAFGRRQCRRALVHRYAVHSGGCSWWSRCPG